MGSRGGNFMSMAACHSFNSTVLLSPVYKNEFSQRPIIKYREQYGQLISDNIGLLRAHQLNLPLSPIHINYNVPDYEKILNELPDSDSFTDLQSMLSSISEANLLKEQMRHVLTSLTTTDETMVNGSYVVNRISRINIKDERNGFAICDSARTGLPDHLPTIYNMPDLLYPVFAFGDINIEHQLHIHGKIKHHLSLDVLTINGLLRDLPITRHPLPLLVMISQKPII
ncbi:unnamed protein product [Clavelina lepadiformis]|uniref:Uncharacterized protein n=1 Tax=Clavelina lepadiformis TaxID=159417 RepID=A0ABP0GH85_CLALP